MKVFVWGVALWAASGLSLLAQPAEIQLAGGIKESGGSYVAESAGTIKLSLESENYFRGVIRTGTAPQSVGVAVQTSADRFKTVFGVTDVKFRGESEPRPEGAIEVAWPSGGGKTRYYVRPNLSLYGSEDRAEVDWDALPKASEHLLTFEVRQEGEMLRFWLDGRFVFEQPNSEPWELITIYLREPGAELVSFRLDTKESNSTIRPVDLTLFAGSSFAGKPLPAETRVEFDPAAKLPAGLKCPEDFAGIPVAGLGRLELATIDLQNNSWAKNGLQGLPETLVTSVPLAMYDAAWVLCASKEDPTRHPSFALRLTRYGSGRGDAVADTEVTLPPEGMEGSRVGTVHAGEAGELPLWLVKVPLKTGQILDLFQWDDNKGKGYPSHRYLDVDVLDIPAFEQIYSSFPAKLGLQHYSWYELRKKPQSSVYLFGLALEESPASLAVETRPRFAAFYAKEDPVYVARVKAAEAGNYTLQWESADVEGRIVETQEKQIKLKAGEEKSVEFPVTAGNGWYAVRLTLTRNGAAAPCLDYRGSFVMLPPDERLAGSESPFSTWWFNWAHGGSDDMEINGPVFLRAGIRKTVLDTGTNLPESVTSPYKVYLDTIRWMRVPSAERKKITVAERVKQHEEWIRRSKELWPSVDRMLVWHEGGNAGAPWPTELWDQPAPPIEVKPGEVNQESWEERMEYLPELAKMVRKEFPGLKLQYGNNGNGLKVIGQLFRNKFPREFIDSIASEVQGLSAYPESYSVDGLQSLWYLREVARKMGYPDVPVTACVEWITRRTQGADAGRFGAVGLRTQAQWYARDAIHALAYGADSISLGTLHDAGNAYYHTSYGAGGFTRRYPEMQPKPAYAAMATLTQVLDQAQYEGEFSTDLLSLHIEEFRHEKNWIYVLWSERGEREVELAFEEKKPNLRAVDLYGREEAAAASRRTVGPGVQYVISPSRLTGVTPEAAASYPLEELPGTMTVVSPMDTTEGWVVVPGRTNTKGVPHTVAGKYTLQTVEDAERGSVIEMKLDADENVWGLHLRSGKLQMKAPPAKMQEADGVGVWVKGNGSGARIRWTIRNEDGSQWRTPDWPTWRYDDMGWFAVNFDGWHYLRYPFQEDPRWKGRGTVVGLQVLMPSQRIHGTELVDIPNLSLRFSDLGLYSDASVKNDVDETPSVLPSDGL